MPCRDRTLTLRCQTRQQHTTLLHQDARLEEDAANGASVHSLPQVNGSVLLVVCVGHDSVTVKHVSNSGAIVKPIITAYMHIVSTEVLVTIMNCFQSKLQITMQLMQSPANGTPSPEQRRIQEYFSLSLRIRIKPQQPRHLMMSRTCLDAKRLSAWTTRSWTSSGSTTSRGDSIKDLRGTTYVQPPTRFKLALQQAQHAILRAIIYNNPFSLAPEPPWKALVLSSGYSWCDLLPMRLRATVHTFWMRDSSSSELRTGLLSGPWYVLNVMLLRCRMPHAEQLHSRNSHEFGRLLH